MKCALLATLLVACGSTMTPGSPDAGAPDAEDPTLINVFAPSYVGCTRRPYPGARVLFYDEAGNLVDRATTGADGWARGHAPSGGTVFAIQPPGFRPWIISTWVAVEPGDHLYSQYPDTTIPPSTRCSSPSGTPTTTVDVVDIPTSVTNVGGFYEGLRGTSPVCYGDVSSAPSTGGIALTFTPPLSTDGNFLSIAMLRDGANWRLNYDGPPSTIDLGAAMPPKVSGLDYHPYGVSTWTADTTEGNGPVIGIWIAFEFGGANSWVVALPPDRTSFTTPTLPSDIEPFPSSTSGVGYYIGGNDPAGYTAFRTDPVAMEQNAYIFAGEVTPQGVYRLTR